MALPILETLLSHPGLYVGTGTDAEDGTVFIARIRVTALPNKAAVSLDYEARHAGNLTQWAEHAVLARDFQGELLLITSHQANPAIVVLKEEKPGWFVNDPSSYLFPMAIRCESEEPGTLRYEWWYSMPGKPVERHDDTVVKLVR
ncbi:MAG TPA: hypothetical protein VE990_10230 [Acidimicrobiales bacterium]|nr:hypothetical protein [Acidimicrobiales bacterium]